jgi:hypothetical protein
MENFTKKIKINIQYNKKTSKERLLLASIADPDPYVFWPPGSGSNSQEVRIPILPSSRKSSKKNLGSYCFVTVL